MEYKQDGDGEPLSMDELSEVLAAGTETTAEEIRDTDDVEIQEPWEAETVAEDDE